MQHLLILGALVTATSGSKKGSAAVIQRSYKDDPVERIWDILYESMTGPQTDFDECWTPDGYSVTPTFYLDPVREEGDEQHEKDLATSAAKWLVDTIYKEFARTDLTWDEVGQGDQDLPLASFLEKYPIVAELSPGGQGWLKNAVIYDLFPIYEWYDDEDKDIYERYVRFRDEIIRQMHAEPDKHLTINRRQSKVLVDKSKAAKLIQRLLPKAQTDEKEDENHTAPVIPVDVLHEPVPVPCVKVKLANANGPSKTSATEAGSPASRVAPKPVSPSVTVPHPCPMGLGPLDWGQVTDVEKAFAADELCRVLHRE